MRGLKTTGQKQIMLFKGRYSWDLCVIVSALLFPKDQLKRLPTSANPQMFVAIRLPKNAALPDPLVKLFVLPFPNLYQNEFGWQSRYAKKKSIIFMVYPGPF